MERITEISEERNIAIRDNKFVYAKYSINSLAHDLIQLLISQINHMEDYLPVFNIPMKQISKSLNYRILKPALLKAQKDLLEEDVYTGEGLPFKICSKFEIHKSPYSIEVEFSEEMKKYLINSSSFTAVRNDLFFELESSSSKKLYIAMRNKLDLNFTTKINNAYTISKDNLIKLLGLGDSYLKLHYSYIEKELEKIISTQLGSYDWKTKKATKAKTELAISYSVEVNKNGVAIFKFTVIPTSEEAERRVELNIKKKLDNEAKQEKEVQKKAEYINKSKSTDFQKPGLKAVDEWLAQGNNTHLTIIDTEVA